MKPIYAQFCGALALTFAIAACVPRPAPAPTPTPAPVATVTPRPVATPSPVPSYSSWMDVPATPGDWRYAAVSGGSLASFGATAGAPLFAIACNSANRRIALTRHGAANGEALTIRSEEATRAIAARPSLDRGALSAELAANDPLLDAMALTKGRFAVEVQGLPTLYIPAWAEVTRVIEDCR